VAFSVCFWIVSDFKIIRSKKAVMHEHTICLLAEHLFFSRGLRKLVFFLLCRGIQGLRNLLENPLLDF